MNKITEKTPRTTFNVQGVLLEVPEPFKSGDIYLDNEASVQNQTYRENVRNNKAAEIAAVIEASGYTKEEKEAGKALPDGVLAECQAIIDAAVETYVFGERTGGGRTADPVRSRALVHAKKLVGDKWKEMGRKTKDYTSKDLSTAAAKVLADNPALMDFARDQIKAEQANFGKIKLA